MGAFLSIWSQEEAVLKKFTLKEILGSDSGHKSVSALLTTPEGEDAVLLCCRNPFPVDNKSWDELLQTTAVEVLAQNDKYQNIRLFLPKEFTDVKATLIYPCNAYDVNKYRSQKIYIFQETAELYFNVVAPYLLENVPSIQWIDQVLRHEAETDRIIVEDFDSSVGFMLLPDLKWDGINMEHFYVLAIVRRKDIKSIRDLTHEHLPLLTNLREKSYTAIKSKYGLRSCELRAYVHYHPSFYHFHVHFISASYDAPGSYIGKAILLDDIIQNIKLRGDYYQKAVLTCTIREQDPLLGILRDSCPDSE